MERKFLMMKPLIFLIVTLSSLFSSTIAVQAEEAAKYQAEAPLPEG